MILAAGVARGQRNVTINDPSAGVVSGAGTFVTGVLGGNIVGYYVDNSEVDHGFIYNGSFTSISSGGFSAVNDPSADSTIGTQVYGLNASGTVVGTYYDSNVNNNGFTHTGTNYATNYTKFNNTTGSGAAGGDGSVLTGITSNGTGWVGYYYDSNDFTHAYYSNGSGASNTTLPLTGALAGASQTQANAITATGGLIGGFYVSSNVYHGFVTANGGTSYTAITDSSAGTGSGQGTQVNGIYQNSNVIAVVGSYSNTTVNNGFYALSYNGGSSYIYNTLNNPSGVGGTSLTGIDGSDSEVVGNYFDSSDVAHGFVDQITLYTNFTWTGGGGSTWAGTTDWSVSGFAPNSTYNPVIFSSGVVTNRSLTLAATESVSNITFQSSQAYTISGGTLAIGPASGNATIAMSGSSGGTLSISSALTLGGELNVQNNANNTLTISGTVTSNNDSIYYNGAGIGTFNLASNFGGSGSITAAASSGTLTLGGANTYNGGTTLTSGTMNINSSTALGTGTLTINGGKMDNTSGGPITLTNNNPIGIDGSFTFGGTNSLNLGTGAVALNSASTITVSANTLTLGGAIGGSGALNKAGAGTLVLNGVNTYNGVTNVSAGTLQVNGSLSAASAVGVSSGAILSGTGTVGGTTTLNTGAILIPGNGGTGTLTVGSLLWNGASSATPTMEITLSNSNNASTAVNVTGAFTKGSGSNFLFDFQGTGFFDGVDPTTYTLVDFGSNSGFSVGDFSYEDLPLYMRGSFELTASSLEFVITTMVPEPGTWGLAAGLAVLGLAVGRRRTQVKSVA